MPMQERWQRFLSEPIGGDLRSTAPGMRDDDGLRAAREHAFLCDLSGAALGSVVGADAEAFLQAQLSSDVKALAPGRSQLAAYNTPKGRMLGLLLLWKTAHGYLFQCPSSIIDALIKRLSMFVLRSKVELTNVSAQYIRIGVGGPQATRVLTECDLPLPAQDYDVLGTALAAQTESPQILRLPGHRYELVYSDAGAAEAFWRRAVARATVADETPWRWLTVRSGIADIEAATQDKYVPQMLNLELLGGVSFTKGCYPGQEIVARAQYRGEIKRRMRLAHVVSPDAPAPGGEVVAVGASAQPVTVGSVAAGAPAPGGGCDVLVCLHLDLAHNAALHLGGPDGPRLELLPLPYSLPQAV